MQILASALPGFRDLRAPLTAGYLWMILLWIWLKPDLAVRPANEIVRAVYDLGAQVGPIWLGLGVSVGAYLIGAVSQSSTPALSNSAKALHRLATHRSRKAGSAGDADAQIIDAISPYEERALAKLIEPSASASPQSRERWQEEREKVIERIVGARRALARELDLPATLLLGKEPALFNEADRLKAESQLRFSVVPPLIAITAFLIAQQAWLFIYLLIPIGILWWQGYSKELEFRSLMLSAFLEDAITSPTITDLKNWVDGMATLRFEGKFRSPIPPEHRSPALESTKCNDDV